MQMGLARTSWSGGQAVHCGRAHPDFLYILHWNGVYPDHILGEVLQACQSTVIIHANIVMAPCTLYVLLCRPTDSSLPWQPGLHHQQSLLGAAP